MNFGIIRFPSTTGHSDMIYILGEILEQEVFEIWHKETKLKKADALIIPGGFSENPKKTVKKSSPIIQGIKKFAANGGFVLGIGHGFQLLCEIGLLPGNLSLNDDKKFRCKNVFLKPKHTFSALTASLNTSFAYKIPIAHSVGKYDADDKTIKNMRENKQILFQYCTEDGHLSEQANPNGSRANIAAICSAEKNVYGIMAHPERAADDEIGNTDGIHIFESIMAYLE